MQPYRLNTRLIHAGERHPRVDGAINLPIYQTVNYECAWAENYESITYLRLNNTPQHQVLHAKLADLEGTSQALVTASGMAAIAATLLGLLKQGEHLLAQRCLYGGTYSLLSQDLPDMGIACDFVDPEQPENWKKHLRPETRIFYVESLSNPLLGVGELEEVCRFAREHGLLTVIDNTLATPINFQPRQLGFDLILHSATKYLNGHSDVAAGVICGEPAQLDPIRFRLNHLGACLDPNSCFLLHRGLKTLGLRLRQQNATALELAGWLQRQSRVKRVYYPGLADSPSHQRAQRWFQGAGGLLSFEMEGSLSEIQEFLNQLELFAQAPSLGGVESLITRPASTSHLGMTAAERAAAGIQDGLIRVAVGLEDVEDLKADLSQALNSKLIA